MTKPSDSDSKRNIGTLMALIALLFVSVGLIGITALVMPQAMGLIAVVFGFVIMGILHYLLWGWWMTRIPFEIDEDEDE